MIKTNTLNRNLHILFLLLLSITIYAQRAPITVTTILTPPYTTSLSTMAESGSTRLMVNLLVNDVTITEIPVKLHIKMESAGITIESIPTQVVRPMFLGGGEARVLTGDDFAEYLRLDNLNFKGLSKDAYVKSGQLPAGLWKFSITVRHFHTNKIISNVGTATAWITSYQPPVLTSPKDGDIAPSNAALPLTFSWQASKHAGGTASIMYRFEMWERRVEGVPAQAVAASVPPIYTTETAGLTATVLPATLALEPGMKYCWRVTAYDPSGMVTIENNGESEVRTFQYLEKCPEVCGLTVDIKDDTGYASWEENRQHLGGYNFEFYDDEGTCHKTLWGSSNKTAGIGGEYGKTWHVRVQGLCRSSVEGPWSDWVDFTIPDAFKPLKDENGNTYECGREVPERVITNFELTDNIQKGDTLEDERGTTKYIIHSATKNEDGSFRGLSYMKLSFWGVKVLGEFNNMKVNTDGVIIGRYAWKSVKSDLLVAAPEAIEKWADELALEMAGATYNNTIKDTIVLEYSKGYVRFETIRREGDKYFAVTSDNKDVEITSMINGKTRALVKDDEGHELVIDKDGNVMGVEEYKKCGGSKALLRENIKEKDSQLTKSGNVKFFSTGDYLFDTYDTYANAAKGYAERFPSIGEGDYKPAYACVESSSKLEIKAAPYANITFKNERGVPVLCKDGILEVTARGDRDTTSIYAYDSDNNIVGKVNVLSYDKVTRKICLVPIGDTKAPDASAVKQGLDEIFAKLMVDFEVTIGEPIAIQYAKDNIFTHGGSGMIGVYNADQKAAISKLKERGIDNETVYLFFVKECNALKANDSPDVVNGYMPRGYQFGFIYKELNNYRTIAHEICHGAFHLKHTFAQDDFLAAERTTDNLMDYNDGKTLNHWQWKDIHQPKSVRFKWLQDEEGAESITLKGPIWVKLPNALTGYFVAPSGRPIYLNLAAESEVCVMAENVAESGNNALSKALYGFTIGDTKYLADIKNGIFNGYAELSAENLSDVFYVWGKDDAAPKSTIVYVWIPAENNATNDVHGKFEEYSVQHKDWFDTTDDTPTRYGTLLYDIDLPEYPFLPCIDKIVKYQLTLRNLSSPNSNDFAHRLYRLIISDPCKYLSGDMLHYDERGPIKSEWMEEFNQVFGTAVNIAMLPAEIVILMPIVLESTTEFLAEDETRRFVEGAVVEAAMYYCISELLEEDIDWTDFSFDVFVAGLRNAAHISKMSQATLACLQGVDLNKMQEFVRKISNLLIAELSNIMKNNGKEEDEYSKANLMLDIAELGLQTSSECIISGVFEYYGNNNSSKLVAAIQRSSMTKYARFLNKFNISQSKKESLISILYNVEKVINRSSKWKADVNRLLTTEDGARAFDILKRANFDLSKLSSKNFERLSNIVSKFDDIEAQKIVELFKGTKDYNRLLIYLEHSGSTAEQYAKAM
ncbi:MAG: hypothetical protein J6Y72_08090, partial [Bacteroidales bacterium]|nr:hypothetical protein [Bacteroidales bacterium]